MAIVHGMCMNRAPLEPGWTASLASACCGAGLTCGGVIPWPALLSLAHLPPLRPPPCHFHSSKVNQYHHTALLKIKDVNDKSDVDFYLGKRVAYIYKVRAMAYSGG